MGSTPNAWDKVGSAVERAVESMNPMNRALATAMVASREPSSDGFLSPTIFGLSGGGGSADAGRTMASVIPAYLACIRLCPPVGAGGRIEGDGVGQHQTLSLDQLALDHG